MAKDRCEGERILDHREFRGEVSGQVIREVVRSVNERAGESSSNFLERATRIGKVPGLESAAEIGQQNYGIYHSRRNVETPSGKVTIRENSLMHFTYAVPLSDAGGTAQEKIGRAPNAYVQIGHPERGITATFGQGDKGLVAQVGNGPIINDPKKVAAELRRAGVTFTPNNARANPLPTVADLHRAAENTYCPPR